MSPYYWYRKERQSNGIASVLNYGDVLDLDALRSNQYWAYQPKSRTVPLLCAARRGFTAARRLLFLAIAVIGIFIAITFMYETTPLGPKLFSLIAIGGNFYALKREINFAKSR